MEKQQLKITVSGGPGAGKSTMIYTWKEVLKEAGFDVKFEGGEDYDNEEKFDRDMENTIDGKIDAIKKSKTIVFEEVTTYRGINKTN